VGAVRTDTLNLKHASQCPHTFAHRHTRAQTHTHTHTHTHRGITKAKKDTKMGY
jgi:hypothetical protein